ncbi:MAG: flagellar motor protein MotB [Granulosicoccaceae bacterium]
MSSEDDLPLEEQDEGLPEWLATFADLMSLLMCFFVLLLSFSEMDILKYKQVAGSMSDAFGVQREVDADEIPKGTSIVAQEFSPGRPDPTVLNVMKQQTSDDSSTYVEVVDDLRVEVEALLELARGELSSEIEQQILEVLPYNNGVMLRIQEHNSFASGSAVVNNEFQIILDNIIGLLNKVSGSIVVAGHSDNLPISTEKFPSNWVLSSARASSVVHYLVTEKMKNTQRLEIRGHADTLPIVDNDTRANQAKNRRIEINIAVSKGDEPFEQQDDEQDIEQQNQQQSEQASEQKDEL